MTTHATPSPKQQRSELSTTRLLDAAAELIAERGYERMTLTAIGQRAGYSPALVTARFGSKEGLLASLLDRITVEWAAENLTPAVGQSTGVEALHRFLDELRANWGRHPHQMRALYVLMFEAVLPAPFLRDRIAELHRDLRRAIAQGVAQASPTADAPSHAMLIVGAIRGAVYQSLLDPEAVPIDSALREVTHLVDALLPDPTPPQ
ncbi:TetR/AcrR family transcriptional regulator [Nocardia pseudovaccinii]|uniref:TetR/AcrR family transcriptional regulator n=1 Tax=Nocardia pseudovaccinii TaxID=189540 RepID=UPI0007A48CA3|nr:TetR/AcrR family transcriptional regulator [Nocardia pseudovaccinii]